MSQLVVVANRFDGGRHHSWLEVSGEHNREGYHVYLYGEPLVITAKPFMWMLELSAAHIERPGQWLYNCDTYSCNGRGRDGVPVDCDAVARDRRRHLVRKLPAQIETGPKGYRFFKDLGVPGIDRRILNIPFLDPRILRRLREVLDRHVS